ncbi:MAG: ATP-dependent helicase [Acidobacteria bacterium]|nr:ATP-dependent helicase [Acidobacteriota bacterium]
MNRNKKDEPNEQQKVAIEHGEGPLLIVAGAGTGKTRVIVERVGYLLKKIPGLEPENILALTFARKAAQQMRDRAVERFGKRAQRCHFSTFHAFCYDLLLEELALRSLDKIDQWIFLRRHLEDLELDYYLKASEPGRFLHDLVDFCSQCHDNLVSPTEYRQFVEKAASEYEKRIREGKPLPDGSQQEIERLRELARVFECSEALQEKENLLSFGAMISKAVFRLKESSGLLHRLQQRYRYILVDEFQDTNAAQWELLKLLAGERKNITVVGDDYQAIYRFRGAADGSLEQFEKEDFTGCQHIGLHQNYRSTKSILNVADAAIAMDDDLYRREKRLTTEKDQGYKVEVLEFADAEQQAEWVAAEIARMVESGKADIAVLYRMHKLKDPLVKALRQRGIPFSIRGLAVNNLPPVRDLVACLRAIGHPEDNVSLARVLADPQWKLEPEQLVEYCRAASHSKTSLRTIVEDVNCSGWPDRSRLLDLLKRYCKISGEQRLESWLEPLRRELGLNDPTYEPALGAFSEFVAQWDKEKSSTGMLPEFLEYFAYFEEAGGTVTLPEQEGPETSREVASRLHAREAVVAEQMGLLEQTAQETSPGKVQLMTVHAAKGLEFEHVFLVHLVRGAFPVRNRQPLISLPAALWKRPLLKGDFHLKEERRLFYVGLTRAKKQLTLCTISNEWQQPKQRPSRFLEELRDANCPDLEWKQVLPIATASTPQPEPQEAPARLGSRIAQWTRRAAPASTENFSLSISQMETYLDCPLKYQYRYVWQVPVAATPALSFGSTLHAAVKQLVATASQDPARLSPETIQEILRQHWPTAGFADPVQERKYREMGFRQLEGLWQTLVRQPFELLHQEKTFHMVQGAIQLVGRIDQINRIAGPDVELIEYKTGRPQTQKEADQSRQITLYALACRKMLKLNPLRLTLHNLETQEAILTKRSPEDFQQLEVEIGEASQGILAGAFVARPGYHCRYCDFRPLCPSWEDQSLENRGAVAHSTVSTRDPNSE